MIVALKGLRVMTWIEEGTKAVLSELSPDGSKRSPGSCSTPTSSCGVRGVGGSGDAEVKEEPSPTAKSGGGLEDNLLTALEPDTINTVLEALKTRIRELEGETRVAGNDKFKCLICMNELEVTQSIRGKSPNAGRHLVPDTRTISATQNASGLPVSHATTVGAVACCSWREDTASNNIQRAEERNKIEMEEKKKKGKWDQTSLQTAITKVLTKELILREASSRNYIPNSTLHDKTSALNQEPGTSSNTVDSSGKGPVSATDLAIAESTTTTCDLVSKESTGSTQESTHETRISSPKPSTSFDPDVIESTRPHDSTNETRISNPKPSTSFDPDIIQTVHKLYRESFPKLILTINVGLRLQIPFNNEHVLSLDERHFVLLTAQLQLAE
uniref:Uncharacterized protein n=1 Tax=Timema douglasi TaxID=61478 RepID=A0A7R8VJE0_TIMDO|nr:unnamed protein product [Timema douglasi]